MNERQKDEYRRLTGQPNKTKWAEDQSASPSSNEQVFRRVETFRSADLAARNSHNNPRGIQVITDGSAGIDVATARRLRDWLNSVLPVETTVHTPPLREVAIKKVVTAIEAWNKQDGRMCDHDYDLMNDARRELKWILEDHESARRQMAGGVRPVEPTSELSRYRCMFCSRPFATIVVLNSHEETCQQERAAEKATAAPTQEWLDRSQGLTGLQYDEHGERLPGNGTTEQT